jgi:uncharacterized membrane protein
MAMKIRKIISLFTLTVILLSAFIVPGMVLAQDEGNTDQMFLTTDFPSIQAQATDTFSYNIAIHYTSNVSQVFELAPSAPAGWNAYVTPQYDSTKISSITAEQAPFSGTKSVKLSAVPPVYPYAAPGDYTISLQVTSDKENMKASIDVTAKILPKGTLSIAPANQSGLYNTSAKSGKDNIYSVTVTNTGTSAIKNVTVSVANKPDGWDVTFTPDKIESLDVLDSQNIDVNIKPPSDTASGDYMLSLRATGEGMTNSVSMDVRVIVQTSTIWGWVGVIIILIVIVGLFAIFMRFGRR